MKKFKEFKVNVKGAPQIIEAMEKHAEYLGFKQHDSDRCKDDYFGMDKVGDYAEISPNSVMGEYAKEISIRDFFKLTPEDVVIEPDRWRCSLAIGLIAPKWAESGVVKSDLTRDQINRIKSIMDEES